MKKLLIASIILYQKNFPKKFRGKCLFRESCSNHVLRITKDNGFKMGCKAFYYRYKNCRPNYYLTKDEKGNILLITSEKEVIEQSNISIKVIKSYKN